MGNLGVKLWKPTRRSNVDARKNSPDTPASDSDLVVMESGAIEGGKQTLKRPGE